MVRKKFTATKTIRGRLYQYFRKDGKYIRLPDDPTSEAYDRAYWAIMRGKGPGSKRLTFDQLILSYKQSPKWTKLAARTKKDYEKVLSYVHDTIGDKDPSKIRHSHIMDAQIANRHRVRFANYIVQVLSVLFRHAIKLEWRTDNPAHGVEMLETGDGYSPWPEWAVDLYRKNATGLDRLIFELAIGTGQRAGDLVKMKWADIEDDGIHVIQGKTDEPVYIPFTEALNETVKAAPKSLKYIISDNHGRKLSYNQIQKINIRTRKRLGIAEFSLHGLRYSAAGELAEAGCSDRQIAAITGHKSMEMIRKYTKGARQKTLAKGAIELRERNKNKTGKWET